VDINLVRPRCRHVSRINLAVDSKLVTSADIEQSVSAIAEDVPITTNKYFTPKKLDYTSGAKAHKKKRRLGTLYGSLSKALFVMAVFALIIMVAGFFVNRKYQGLALPLTYVGDVAIGGMNQDQIKKTLDEHYNNMAITFVDGGLVRKATLEQLDIKADTKAISEQAVPKRFNPFSYLNWQRYEVPIQVNDRIVAGYMQTKFNSSKTKSEDASIGIDKNKLKVYGELVGFQADSKNIVQQIKNSLAKATEPRINVNAVTVKPKVGAIDLTDDFNRANTMLQTAITIKYGYANIKPTLQQKIAWMQIRQEPGSTYVNVEFSKGLIRAYILEQVQKMQAYQTAKKVEQVAATASATLTTTPMPEDKTDQNIMIIENIDEAADAVVASLKSASALNQQLTIKQINSDKSIGANTTIGGNTVASVQSIR